MRTGLALVLLVVAACGGGDAGGGDKSASSTTASPEKVGKLGKLGEVMEVQEKTTDPLFKKIGAKTYSNDDWKSFTQASEVLQSTSRKMKEFSKGPDFDTMANQVEAGAQILAAAASSKDVSGASAALSHIKQVCKDCHAKFH
jgi:cytochrome c556